jgi:hypothetical protein
VSENAKSLIDALLKTNPRERLGSGGVDEIKNHPFFEGINWDDVLKKKVKPPYVPVIKKIEEDEIMIYKATPEHNNIFNPKVDGFTYQENDHGTQLKELY